MTCDPFPGRCRRCGLGLMDDSDDCGRGPDECQDELAIVRDVIAGACSAVARVAGAAGRALVAAGRRLGLLE